MRAAKERTLRAGIPLDSQCADIDVMKDPGRDFTISDSRFKQLPRYSYELQSQGIRLIPLLDPFIYTPALPWRRRDWALREGDRLGIWAKDSNGRDDATGSGWFVYNAKYPDYTNPVTKVQWCKSNDFLHDKCFNYQSTPQAWWSKMIQFFHRRRLRFDGLTIDLNEPTSLTVFPIKCKSELANV